MVLQVNASHDGLRQSASEYEATIRQLQSELAEVKEQHQEAREEVGLRGRGWGRWYGMYTSHWRGGGRIMGYMEMTVPVVSLRIP